jgi:hypothetical protein
MSSTSMEVSSALPFSSPCAAWAIPEIIRNFTLPHSTLFVIF